MASDKNHASKIKQVSKKILQKPNESLLAHERAHLYLASGETRLARADFDQTIGLQSRMFRTRPGNLQSDGELNAIGVTYWMEGHKELAASFWRYTTESLTANRVQYSHHGGGIESGQMLWFSAVHLKRPDDVERTAALFKNRLRSKHWSHSLNGWPGPLVQFFFRKIDEEELLALAVKHDTRPNASPRKEDRLMVHAQCKAEFAIAARAKENSRGAAYRSHILKAAEITKNLYDCYNVFEYFLARAERARLLGQT